MIKSVVWVLFLTVLNFAQVPDSTNQWGYGYKALLQDLEIWRASPYVRIDSIGASVQKRALWKVSITEGENLGKQRIFIHARTHPSEVQAFYVAREMMRLLLDSSVNSAQLRREFIFDFIPMYNPDGVELGYGRLNANRIDIESNWNNLSPQPEVLALKAEFTRLMQSGQPIRVALNLHSDSYNCKRFFFFHAAAGTSDAFVALEKEYINQVRNYFIDGIEPWTFIESWTTQTQLQYPESFWWLNYRESVMALTYEDANCSSAGQFDKSGRALVLGSVDYVRSHPTAILAKLRPVLQRGRKVGSHATFEVLRHGRYEFYDLEGRRLYR